MFSIVMATFDDYDGVKFTAHDLLIHHGDLVNEVVVVDNNPNGRVGKAIKDYCDKHDRIRYIPFTEVVGTSAPRNAAVRAATSEYVVCLDSHVILFPGALESLARFYDQNPELKDDLVQGPLVYDSLNVLDTHFADEWGAFMWGRFRHDKGFGRSYDRRVDKEPFFEIWAMGLGVFATRRDSWIGFNPRNRGFGGEEVLIHEAYRQAGRKTWCLSDLRWWHEAFSRPQQSHYPNSLIDRARNYIIGMTELGLADQLVRAREHFIEGGFSAVTWDKLLADPDAPCSSCNKSEKKASSSVMTNPLTVTTEMVIPTRLGAKKLPQRQQVLARQPAWADRLRTLGKIRVSFGNHTADAVVKWVGENAPRSDRYLAIHGIEQHGEVWKDSTGRDILGIMPAVRQFLKNNAEWSVVEFVEGDGGLLVLSKSDEDRPKIKSGPAEKVLAFAKSKFKQLLGGNHYLPLPMAEERLDKCLVCPSMAADRRCSICSCFLVERPNGKPGKVFHPHDSCPLGKWLNVEVPKGGFKETGGSPPVEQSIELPEA